MVYDGNRNAKRCDALRWLPVAEVALIGVTKRFGDVVPVKDVSRDRSINWRSIVEASV